MAGIALGSIVHHYSGHFPILSQVADSDVLTAVIDSGNSFLVLLGAGLPAYRLGLRRHDELAAGIAMSTRRAVELIVADFALRAGLLDVPSPPPPVVAQRFSANRIAAEPTTLITPVELRRALRARA